MTAFISKQLRRFFLLCLCILAVSCSHFTDYSNTELTLALPYGTSRFTSAITSRAGDSEDESYTYKVTFEHEKGTVTELSGKSGEVITLSPAEPGKYTVSGEAYLGEVIVYQGSCETEAKAGSSNNVELVLNKIAKEPEKEAEKPKYEASTKHAKAESDSTGIKITLTFNDGDEKWRDGVTFIVDEDCGTAIEINDLPTAGNSVTY